MVEREKRLSPLERTGHGRFGNAFSLHCAAFLSAVTMIALPPASQTAVAYPLTPQVVVESGIHGAVIKRVAVDRFGQLLVSGSDDATVRVWSAASGELLRPIRVPRIGRDGRYYGRTR